jgi:CRISPR-associated protein Cmr2
MNTYFALTIGPIYKTLSQAQRTREFWGSSYMFSWIMREIILGMIAEKTISEDEILMPNRNKHDLNLKVGTGLYHDRMIAQIVTEKKDNVLDDFKKVVDAVFDEIVRNISPELKIDRAVLQSYFRLNVVLLDLEDGINIVETVTNYLDSLELQNPIFHEAWKIDWPSVIADLNGSLLYSDAFSKGSNFDFVFDSIPEITTRGLRMLINKNQNKEEIESRYDYWVKEDITTMLIQEKKEKKRLKSKEVIKIQDTFIDDLSKDSLFKDAFCNYHKYIAIVHADGDNFGKTISSIGGSPEEVKNLSRLLFNFAKDAAKAITEYGGTNVYAGGDDLLFFAPVAIVNDHENKTIFDLINNLDDHFKTTVCDKLTKIAEADRPTLSWGVSISYYKFPLSEAIVSSRKLLFDDAKEYEGKNSVAFKLIKHTGQFFGATFGKGGSDYKYFTNLLKDKFNTETDFISSLQYRISENEALLRAIFKVSDYPTRIENFFDNFFDEEIHSNKKDFVHSVRDMLTQAFTDSKLPEKVFEKMTEEKKEKAHKNSVKTAIDKTYSALRFIHFLNSKSDE